ncbi:MAG: hypothetical protein RhofKO_11030 [Rhodothermales bacterium]
MKYIKYLSLFTLVLGLSFITHEAHAQDPVVTNITFTGTIIDGSGNVDLEFRATVNNFGQTLGTDYTLGWAASPGTVVSTYNIHARISPGSETITVTVTVYVDGNATSSYSETFNRDDLTGISA